MISMMKWHLKFNCHYSHQRREGFSCDIRKSNAFSGVFGQKAYGRDPNTVGLVLVLRRKDEKIGRWGDEILMMLLLQFGIFIFCWSDQQTFRVWDVAAACLVSILLEGWKISPNTLAHHALLFLLSLALIEKSQQMTSSERLQTSRRKKKQKSRQMTSRERLRTSRRKKKKQKKKTEAQKKESANDKERMTLEDQFFLLFAECDVFSYCAFPDLQARLNMQVIQQTITLIIRLCNMILYFLVIVLYTICLHILMSYRLNNNNNSLLYLSKQPNSHSASASAQAINSVEVDH